MGLFWAVGWATIFGGGPYRVSASENALMEVGSLKCPPRLSLINQGGCFRPTINRGNYITVLASVKY